MIEKILERFGKERVNSNVPTDVDFWSYLRGISRCEEIVQEVAKDGGWIPCSERLPEEKETVILSTQLGTCAGCYFCGGWYRENMLCYDSAVRERDVIAWQPLPAPYQKGE